jgi:hypothetical protein
MIRLVGICGSIVGLALAPSSLASARSSAAHALAAAPQDRVSTCTIREPGSAVVRRWAGGCHRGLGDGHGAGPMRLNDEEGVFAGRASNGRPISGVLTLPDGGFFLLAPENPHPPPYTDAAAWASDLAFRDAFAGAAAAARAYQAAGNTASARYYVTLRRHLIEGQPE